MSASATMTTHHRLPGGVEQDQLRASLAALRRTSNWKPPTPSGRQVSAEVEFFIFDDEGRPVRWRPEDLHDPRVGLELPIFGGEFGLTPVPLEGRPFTALGDELTGLVRTTNDHVRPLGGSLVLVGTPPTLDELDSHEDNCAESDRYHSLEAGVKAHRPPFDRRNPWANVFPEACTGSIWPLMTSASLQLNLDTSPGEFPAFYDAARIIDGIMVGLGANDPLAWGRPHQGPSGQFIAASRIPIFELTTGGRAGFNSGPTPSFVGYFERNACRWPILLAPDDNTDPLNPVKAHNGTVWGWTARPKIAMDPQTSERVAVIEGRSTSMPATVADAMALLAFQTGLIAQLAGDIEHWRHIVPFTTACKNFYSGIYGLDGLIRWPRRRLSVRELTLQLLGDAEAGLKMLGVDSGESSHFLGIIEETAGRGQNGAAWQLQAYQRLLVGNGDRQLTRKCLMRLYRKHAATGDPVHTWPLPV